MGRCTSEKYGSARALGRGPPCIGPPYIAHTLAVDRLRRRTTGHFSVHDLQDLSTPSDASSHDGRGELACSLLRLVLTKLAADARKVDH